MKVRTVVRLALFLAGLAILVALVVRLDVEEVLGLVARTRWHLILILLVYGGSHLARAGALWLCQPIPGVVPYWTVLRVRLSAEAVRLLSFMGPALSEPGKVWLLTRHGLDTQTGIAAIVAELISHSVVAAPISLAAMGFLLLTMDLDAAVRTTVVALSIGLAVYLVVVVIAVTCRIYLIGKGAALMDRVGLFPLPWKADDVRRMEDHLLLVLRDRPRRLLLVLSCQIASNLLLMGEVAIALTAMEVPYPGHYPMVVEGALKFVSVVFFFVPTQVGVSEGAYALFFDALGLTAAAGVSLAFVRRLRTLLAAAIGLMAMLVLSAGDGESDASEPHPEDDPERRCERES